MSTIDYVTVAYGPYASSAAGAIGFSVDALAAASTMCSNPRKTDYFFPWSMTPPTIDPQFTNTLAWNMLRRC